MQFTFRVDPYIYNGIKELAARHKVKVGTVLNALVRRGLIVGLVHPFEPLPSHQDDKALLKELEELGKEGEALFCEFFGVDLNKLSFDELVEMADGRKMAEAIIAKHCPGFPMPSHWDNYVDLYREVADWETDQKELEKELAALDSFDDLSKALAEMEDG
jgi:hypothetical protein